MCMFDYLQTRSVTEVSLRRLAVVMGAMTHGTIRCAERQPSNIELPAAAVAVLGRLIYDLIKCGKDVIRKLHLRDGSMPNGCHTNCKTSDTLKTSNR